MSRMAAGDKEALAELYARYSRLVYSFALKVTGDGGMAEDVTQDVFLRVWRSAARFDPERGRLGSWMLQITRNRALDLWHASSRSYPAGSGEEVAGYAPTATVDPGDEITLALQVRSALDGLNVEQRQAVELAYYQGLTHQQIAERTRSPLGTVKGRLRVALIRLRQRLTAGSTEEVKRRGL